MQNKIKRFFSSALCLGLFFAFSSCEQDESPEALPTGQKGDLNVRLQYPSKVAYDSAVIVFKNSSSEIRHKLVLNNALKIAAGSLTVPAGDWQVSSFYYSFKNHATLETTGVADLQITSETYELTSEENNITTFDGVSSVRKPFTWASHYRYHLYLDNVLEGFVKLPGDPLDPFIQITTFRSAWTYAYADRLFFKSEVSNYEHRAGSAFEVYESVRNIVDTTSFEPLTSAMRDDRSWNFVDCVIILLDDQDREIFLYHIWDFRSNARIQSESNKILSKPDVQSRMRIQLNRQ